MESWKVSLQASPQVTRILMTDPEHNELLKARLPGYPEHPRALLGLLESLALWMGEPVTAAISAEGWAHARCGEAFFGDGPMDSALVHFESLAPVRRRRTISGVGDFRQLRLRHARQS